MDLAVPAQGVTLDLCESRATDRLVFDVDTALRCINGRNILFVDAELPSPNRECLASGRRGGIVIAAGRRNLLESGSCHRGRGESGPTWNPAGNDYIADVGEANEAYDPPVLLPRCRSAQLESLENEIDGALPSRNRCAHYATEVGDDAILSPGVAIIVDDNLTARMQSQPLGGFKRAEVRS